MLINTSRSIYFRIGVYSPPCEIQQDAMIPSAVRSARSWAELHRLWSAR